MLNLEKIRSLMKGRTITEVANAMGVAQPNLSRILSGKHPNLPISQIDRLAKALGVSAKTIIE